MHQGDLEYRDREGRRHVGHLVVRTVRKDRRSCWRTTHPAWTTLNAASRGGLPGSATLSFADYVGNGELLGMDQAHSRLGAAIADTTLAARCDHRRVRGVDRAARRRRRQGRCDRLLPGWRGCGGLPPDASDDGAGKRSKHQGQDPGPDGCRRHHGACRRAHAVRGADERGRCRSAHDPPQRGPARIHRPRSVVPGLRFDRTADERSWRAMLDLFEESIAGLALLDEGRRPFPATAAESTTAHV